MQLLNSWRDSLTVLKPQNFWLFTLVTLKSLVETYKVWLKYWGWLVLLFLGYNYWIGESGPLLATLGLGFGVLEGADAARWLLYGIMLLIYTTLVLTVRPSVDIKNSVYFLGYGKHLFWIMCWFIMITALANFFVIYFYGYMLFPFVTVLFTLFLLDSRGTCKDASQSTWRAIQMFVYNLPFYLVMIGLFFVLIPLLLMFGSARYSAILYYIIDVLVVLPLFVNVVTNFYVKRLHEQFTLYFPQK